MTRPLKALAGTVLALGLWLEARCALRHLRHH